MIKKLMLLIIVFFSAAQCLEAQKVVKSVDLYNDTINTDFGMNRKHYFHGCLGFHFPVGGQDDQARVASGRSWTLEYGQRYKRKYSEVFSGGLEAVLKRSSFHPDRFYPVEIPEEYDYDREKFVFLSFGVAGYQRINYSPRGNYIGRFVDIGVFGDVHYNVRHIMRLEGRDENLRIRRSQMGLHETFSYGLIARAGFNNFVLKGSYRVSDIFKPDAGLPEFTRYKLGIEFGFHPL